MRGASRVDLDGGLDAQALRFEGNIGGRTVGIHGIITRFAAADGIGICVEEPCCGQFAAVKARFASAPNQLIRFSPFDKINKDTEQ